MSANDDVSIATRASLLERLKDLDDATSWQHFFDTYWRLIHRVGLRAGLTEAEAQDVVQETVISVARHLPGFRYDPEVCSFKTWMLRLTRWRIIDQLRRRIPSQPNPPPAEEAGSLATREQGLGCGAVDLEAVWNEEWQSALLAAALERLKQKVNPEQFQMFDLYALRQMPVAEVARLLGTTITRVYLAKHRTSKQLRQALADLQREDRW